LLDPVAACRQCYVKVEGQRKLMTACSTPVTEGMEVATQFTDEEVHAAQVANLEFLLLNHPLDCPVCDRGGECPLQDQTLAFGPGESRYVEAKRTYRKPLPLSPLVSLDRERCVLCARCTRFCDQISGDRFIELFDRGAAEQVSIGAGADFRSPFSGNTIQICPVGALTSTTYRFAARPFDVASGESICPHCAAGCAIRVDLRRGEVVRHLARDDADVNEAWICDKGRFGHAYVDRPGRLTTPMLREGGLVPVSFEEAFAAIAGWCRDARVAVLAGGRLSDEDAYALSKLARTAFGTNDVDHRMGGGLDVPVEVERAEASGMPVTYADVEGAAAILVVGLDAEQELPILHLRIRKAARRGAAVFVLHPRRTRLADVAEHVPCLPGDEAGLLGGTIGIEPDGPAARAFEALQAAGERGVVLAGPLLAEQPGAVAAAARFAEAVGARFALACRRANDRGASNAGLHPAWLPGGRAVGVEDDRAAVEVAWGTLLSTEPGRDTLGILQAAAERRVDVLFLVGVDPLRDIPDAMLARRALENVRHKVVVDISSEAMAIYADAMLPAAAYLEKDGHYSDWEGRARRLRPVRPAPGLARSEWEIFQALSAAMGHDMGFSSVDGLRREMAGLARRAEAPPAGVARAGRPPPAPSPPDAGRPPGDSLILLSYPLLVGDGVMLAGADRLKDALQDPAFVEVHPADAARLGLSDGDGAVLSTERGEATLPVRVTDGITEGCVFVPLDQPGLAANRLLSGRHVTAVTVAAAAAPDEAAAAQGVPA
jgi:NADH-quinone oxidoreductase subunit G